MLKRIVLTAAAVLFALLPVAGCSRKASPPAEVPVADSLKNFDKYKKDLLAILKKSGVDYTLDDTELGHMEGTAAEVFRVTLNSADMAAAVVMMTNPGNIERFTVSFHINRKTLDECRLNTRDYPWLVKMFNYLTDVNLSNAACNRFIRSARRSVDNDAESQPAFYLTESKNYDEDDEKGLSLKYDIFYKTGSNPAVYEETLSLSGYLSPA